VEMSCYESVFARNSDEARERGLIDDCQVGSTLRLISTPAFFSPAMNRL